MRQALLVVSLTLVGCGLDFGPFPPSDAGATGGGGGGTCDVPALFARSCVTGCHDATTRQGNLDLATPPLEARLFGAHASARPDYLLIDPELPDESALVVKLSATPPFGPQVPLGPPFGAPDRGWLLGGAATSSGARCRSTRTRATPVAWRSWRGSHRSTSSYSCST